MKKFRIRKLECGDRYCVFKHDNKFYTALELTNRGDREILVYKSDSKGLNFRLLEYGLLYRKRGRSLEEGIEDFKSLHHLHV